MLNKNEVLLVPGTIQEVKNYKSYYGLDIWIKKEVKVSNQVKCFIGHSLGASFCLQANQDPECKFILINPLIKKRNYGDLFVRWVKFHLFEGLKNEKIAHIKYWPHVVRQVHSLLMFDAFEAMKKIPRENIIVIRGKYDNFFCDNEDVKILQKNNFKVIEVEAGHDWNENVANAVTEIVRSSEY